MVLKVTTSATVVKVSTKIIAPHLLSLCVLTQACTYTAAVESPENIAAEEQSWLRIQWLAGKEDQVSRALVQKLTDDVNAFAPHIVGTFPKVDFSSVVLVNDARNSREKQSVETSLKHIFQNIWEQVFMSPGATGIVAAQGTVFFMRAKRSGTDTAMMVPTAVLCYGTILFLCPIEDKQLAKVTIEFKAKDAPPVVVTGLGAARTVYSTPLIADNDAATDEIIAEGSTKALVAALVDAVKNAKTKGLWK